MVKEKLLARFGLQKREPFGIVITTDPGPDPDDIKGAWLEGWRVRRSLARRTAHCRARILSRVLIRSAACGTRARALDAVPRALLPTAALLIAGVLHKQGDVVLHAVVTNGEHARTPPRRSRAPRTLLPLVRAAGGARR